MRVEDNNPCLICVYVCAYYLGVFMFKRVCDMSAERLINVLVFSDPISCILIVVIVIAVMNVMLLLLFLKLL